MKRLDMLRDVLNTTQEIHATVEGFKAGFCSINPWSIPACPQKFTGYDPLIGYNIDQDDQAYYDIASIIGYCGKYVLIVFVGWDLVMA